MLSRKRFGQLHLGQRHGEKRALRRFHGADRVHQLLAHAHSAHAVRKQRNVHPLGKDRRFHLRAPFERLGKELCSVAEIFPALFSIRPGGRQLAQMCHQRILPARDGFRIHFSLSPQFLIKYVSHYIINCSPLSSKRIPPVFSFCTIPAPPLYSAAPFVVH